MSGNGGGPILSFVSLHDAPLSSFVLVATEATSVTAVFTSSEGWVTETKTLNVTTSPATLTSLYGGTIPTTNVGCLFVPGAGGTVYCAPSYDGSSIVYTPSASYLSQRASQGGGIVVGTGVPAALTPASSSATVLSDGGGSGDTATIDGNGNLHVQPYYSYGGTPTVPTCGPNGETLMAPGRGSLVQVTTRTAGSSTINDCIVPTGAYPGAVFHINVVAGSGSTGFDTYGSFQASYDGAWIDIDAQQILLNATSTAVVPTQSPSPSLYTASDTIWQVYAPGADQIRYRANAPGSNDTVTTYGYPVVAQPLPPMNRDFVTNANLSGLSAGTSQIRYFNRWYRNMLAIVQLTPSGGSGVTGTFTPGIQVFDSRFGTVNVIQAGSATNFGGSVSYTYLIAAGINATAGIGTHQLLTLLPPEFNLTCAVTLSSGTYGLIVRSCFFV